jgi:hypothetical protein
MVLADFYIGYDNQVHFYKAGQTESIYKNYTFGNTGVKVGDLTPETLNKINVPAQTTWSPANVAKNLPGEINNFLGGTDKALTKYLVLGIAALALIAVIK